MSFAKFTREKLLLLLMNYVYFYITSITFFNLNGDLIDDSLISNSYLFFIVLIKPILI
jgi:hypothetical protein